MGTQLKRLMHYEYNVAKPEISMFSGLFYSTDDQNFLKSVDTVENFSLEYSLD